MAWAFQIDGVPISERRGFSCVPVNGVLLSLPPDVRYKLANNFLFGYWIGSSQPNMQVMMKPFVNSLNESFLHGHKVILNGENVISRSLLIYNDADMLMKRCLSNSSGPTAKKGCGKCNFSGESIENPDSKKKVVKFACSNENDLKSMRTEQEWQASMTTAELKKQQVYAKQKANGRQHHEIVKSKEYTSVAKDGIKGLCVFLLLPYLCAIELCITQPMHCLYEK